MNEKNCRGMQRWHITRLRQIKNQGCDSYQKIKRKTNNREAWKIGVNQFIYWKL